MANVRRAGGIMVGRTNTPELSMRPTTYNPLRGRTLNPWDPAISPGGSSGGAGASAAAGFGPLHHGNDIAGSLRYPASQCGVATIKPTQGRIPPSTHLRLRNEACSRRSCPRRAPSPDRLPMCASAQW